MPSEPAHRTEKDTKAEEGVSAPGSLPDRVLHSIPAHVAVLDREGVIVAVNEAWRQFAVLNEMAGTRFGVGENYITMCESATGECSDEAQSVAAGIRGVLRGELGEFMLDYPCHSPTTSRWFRLMVAPLGGASREGAVVMHINITGPQQAAEALREAEVLARESQRRLTFALEAANIGDWSLDLKTNRAHRSLRHDECFGYTELLPEWTYDTFLAHVDPQDRAQVDACFQAALMKEGEYNIEFRTRWKDESLHWLWTRGRFTFAPDGSPERVAGIVVDITERKNAEEAVARALERLTEAQRIAAIGDWEYEIATERIGWSAQVFAIIGRDPALGTPQSMEELERHFDRASVAVQAEHVAAAIATRERQVYELVARRPDGTSTFIEVVALPRIGHHGEVSGLYGTIQDISDRKRAEEVREQLASIVSSSDDAIIGENMQSFITSWNRGAQRIFGYTAEEIVGRSILEIIPDDRRGDERHIIEQVRRGVGLEHFETVRRRKDGQLIEVSITASPIRDASGAIVGVSKVARDISERKRLEAQFLRVQRVESIGTLAGGIAHDLNNVLQPIMLSLEMLREKFIDEESEEILSVIERSAMHGADMVKQVLTFAKGVDGARLDVDVGVLLRDLEKMARDTFLKAIDVRAQIAPDLWHVDGDPTQLHQVLLNLSVNARDAMPHGGSLGLNAENVDLDAHYSGLNPEARVGPYVCIRVVDTGEGIPQDMLDKIFDPFFTTKEVGKGTGLGLSTSQAIVKSHGGFMRVYSEPGHGTTFTVYLPARVEVSESSEPASIDMPRGRGELILVVDDEPSVREITRRTLEVFGYRTLLAGDGAEAVALFARRDAEIAAVLVDMTMPIMDGPATIRVLQKMSPAVRIIGASGLDAGDQVAMLGVKHFLSKPYSASVLLKTLREVIEGSPMSREGNGASA